jgi:hypothetical protein
MRKISPFIILFFFIIFTGCGSQKNTQVAPVSASSESLSIFPVTSFLKGQLLEIDSMPVTPLQIITVDGKSDSTWLKRADIRSLASPFLTPVIDSLTMSSLFSEKSFLDQTINSFTFSYDPKTTLPDSLHIRHWDVYINPQTNSVSRVYMVKEKNENNIDSTIQLTWLADKWYSIRTIEKEPGKEPKVKEMKMIWNF